MITAGTTSRMAAAFPAIGSGSSKRDPIFDLIQAHRAAALAYDRTPEAEVRRAEVAHEKMSRAWDSLMKGRPTSPEGVAAFARYTHSVCAELNDNEGAAMALKALAAALS